jgi:hypothetical protein
VFNKYSVPAAEAYLDANSKTTNGALFFKGLEALLEEVPLDPNEDFNMSVEDVRKRLGISR